MLQPIPTPQLNPELLSLAHRQAAHLDHHLEDLPALSRALRAALARAADEPLAGGHEEPLAVLEQELRQATQQLEDVRTLIRLAGGGR